MSKSTQVRHPLYDQAVRKKLKTKTLFGNE
jgi:hypothetical protein